MDFCAKMGGGERGKKIKNKSPSSQKRESYVHNSKLVFISTFRTGNSLNLILSHKGLNFNKIF